MLNKPCPAITQCRNIPACRWLAILAWLAIMLIVVPCAAQKVSYFQTGEEFCGPFPSWKNVQTDFGAKGDGITDDAPAIRAALDVINSGARGGDFSTLYFPAGTYLINSTVLNSKRNGTMTLVGEDPATPPFSAEITLLRQGSGREPCSA